MVASDIDSEDGIVTRLINKTTLTITVIDVNDKCPAVFWDTHQLLTLNMAMCSLFSSYAQTVMRKKCSTYC